MVKQNKKIAKRNNEPLWNQCKNEALEKMGKFSARSMQYAVKLYKERGGGYIGAKSKDNSLVKWTKGYGLKDKISSQENIKI